MEKELKVAFKNARVIEEAPERHTLVEWFLTICGIVVVFWIMFGA